MMDQAVKKGKSLTLKNVPEGIYQLLIDEQAKIRKETGKVVSLERVIYRLIRSK